MIKLERIERREIIKYLSRERERAPVISQKKHTDINKTTWCLSKESINVPNRITMMHFLPKSSPEDKYTFKTETTMRTTSLEFKVGEDWVETMPGDNKVNCSATLEVNTLTIIQRPQDAPEKMITIVREFSDEGISVTMTIEKVVCKQFFYEAVIQK
ncbi:unnamed protein product [Lepeophtheirus salmonis]|uniref:(salmon louse) hypothetical protein n=1 Tax=Lepeophtheirus salmonis TaxID=72036 RepID=A0A7R8D190_LEPSM|nr:unnamed protein product [Lepeophtheirus salmonis]CAF2993551.1 unnamed protein product [Lepeophtheirus salmonis]